MEAPALRVVPMETTARCTACGEEKPVEAFGVERKRDGRVYQRSQCKACRSKVSASWNRKNRPAGVVAAKRYQNADGSQMTARHRRLHRNYGLTPQAYEALARGQGNACAICRKPETATDAKTKRPRALAVDHDHVTGNVRGLLCSRCNVALGLFGDSSKALASAIAYLDRARGRKS